MSAAAVQKLVASSTQEFLLRIVEHVLLEATRRTCNQPSSEIAVYGPETSNVIGWFRPIKSEVEALESLPEISSILESEQNATLYRCIPIDDVLIDSN